MPATCFLPPEQAGSCLSAARAAVRHLLPGCLPPRCAWRRHDTLASLSLSLEPLALFLTSPPPLLSLPHAPERSPSPPTPFTRATTTPSLPLCIPKLRPDPVELHTRRTRPEGAAVNRSVVVLISGARRSPSSIRRCRGFPEPTELLSRPLVSPCPFPLSPRARPCLLTTPTVGADRSSPPAMTQTVLEPP